MNDLDLMLRFLLQLLAILICCRIVGWFGQKFLGQTQVVMEMVTGVMLGPSLFGILAPSFQAWLFPKKLEVAPDVMINHPSMSILYIIAQIGLVLYMFVVGLEFDLSLVTSKARSAILVSISGIVAPLLIGGFIGYSLRGNTDFFGSQVTTFNGALYMGAAMCITAFPMLARIIYERGISKTSMGTLTLAAGASDDAVAWAMLAVVLSLNSGSYSHAVFAIGGGTLFATLLFAFGRAQLAKMETWIIREGRMTQPMFLVSMILLFAGAYITDAIGIYAVFGAFLIGAALPKGQLNNALRKQLELPVTTLFVPFFFVYSGLNTKIGLVNTPALWGLTAVVVIAAIVGKGVACGLAARWTGETWRDASAIGVLMNSRGLMELIILNFALQAKIITPTLFTIMVIMAVVTTLMASPLFQWIYADRDKHLQDNKIIPGAKA